MELAIFILNVGLGVLILLALQLLRAERDLLREMVSLLSAIREAIR